MSTATQAPAMFAVAFAALFAAHEVGDHWIQRGSDALAKGGTGWPARLACAHHVATLTVTKIAMLVVPFLMFHLPIQIGWWIAGLGADAASHYWADRRTTLRWLANAVGKGEFFDLGAPRPGHKDQQHLGTGAYALDQSFHVLWLFITALIIAGGAR